LAVPAALILTVALAVILSSRRALNHATQASVSAGRLIFTRNTLDPSSRLAQSPGFELVASRENYTSGALFNGEMYLGGPSGLTVLGPDGASRRKLRSGFELPVAPIEAIAVARLRGTGEPQIMLATAGAGLLMLESGSGAAPAMHQILPADADARDLTALLPLAGGDLLLGTRHRGALSYNGETLTPLRFTLPGIDPASLEVTAMAAVDSASFLIGTRGKGLFYVHAGTVDHADTRSGLPDDEVASLAVSPDSRRAFVGTPAGAAEFDLGAPSFRPTANLAPGIFSHALYYDQNRLMIGTFDQGVEEIPLDGARYLRRASISAGPDISSMSGSVSDSMARVDAFLPSADALYALAGGALLRKAGADWTPVRPPQAAALTDANISALAFAPDGTLYVGFFDRGLDLLSPQGTIHHLEDDHLFCINRLVLNPQRHTIAAATANGLVLFDASGVPRQTLTRRDGLISDHVSDIAFTGTGTALATSAGITLLDASGAQSLYAFQGLVNNHVYALASVAGSGRLFAGTLGGISILTANSVERNLNMANSALKRNWITALLPMPENTMLVGTYGGGIETLDAQGRFAPIELPAGTPRDLVINPNALFATSSHIYAGTLGHGLLVYSVSAGRWSTITSGLPSLNVTAFAERAGEIYIGTENGLVRIAEAGL
jgi:ligand-binding sensor domain-containing protein